MHWLSFGFRPFLGGGNSQPIPIVLELAVEFTINTINNVNFIITSFSTL